MKPAKEKSPTVLPSDGLVPLESILCTEELNRRPSRPPDYETENRALVALAQALADSPRTILQKLADTLLEVFEAHSAGLSLLTEDGQKFYWPAIAGAWRRHIGGGTPRDFGPCGDVLDRNTPLLFKRFERRYPHLLDATPHAEEALLIPFYVHGKAVGTIWAMAHDEHRKFDAEDLRQLESLGRFASASYQAAQLEQVRDSGRAALNLMVDAVLSRQVMDTLNLQLRESECRFREMIDALPTAIYTTDAQGRLTHFNPAAVEFSGRMPELGTDQWCVSWKLYHPDGAPMAHGECPMAIALKEGRIVRGAEAIAERPDGKRIWFEAYPTPLRDGQGRVTGGINMLVDITDRKRAEEARARLAAIVESSADAIVGKDLNGIIQSWNSGAERLFGYTAQEAIGQPVTILIPPDHLDEEPEILRRIRRGERIEHYETIRRRKDGTLLNISLTVSPIADGSGRITGASKIARDITEQKRSEAALRYSEERYRSLFASMDEGFCIIEKVEGEAGKLLDFRYVEANPAFSTQSGVGGVVGKTIRQAFPGEPEEWFLTYDTVLETGEPIRFERGLLTQGRVLELYAFRIEDETGRRVAVIFKDITKQKRSGAALRHSEERYRTLFESAPVGVFLCDSSAVVQDYNRRAEDFWGRAPERGDPRERYSESFELLPYDDRAAGPRALPHAESPLVEVLRTGIPAMNVEGFIKRPDGSRIPVLINFFPLKNELGEITGAIASFNDITELKRTQDALRSANADLQQFGYTISHDLQESLRMDLIYTKMLATRYQGKLDAQADQFIDYAVKGAQRMEAMLGDLREYWSVSEQHEARPVSIDCNEVLDGALRSLEMRVREGDAVVTHDPLPTVMAEEVPLALLFQNLIGNALKYHRPDEQPRIHISARRAGKAWTFAISDNGIGIKAEYLEQIFTPFKRLHGTEYVGNGIGLAICQKVVTRYGGRIWAESTYGQGSTFRFTIPA
jgi:PAS domain S-box-containing protein